MLEFILAIEAADKEQYEHFDKMKFPDEVVDAGTNPLED